MKLKRKLLAGVTVAGLVAGFAGVASADTLVMPTADTTAAPGATIQASVYLVATDTPSNDEIAGCNATPDHPVVVSFASSNTSVADAPSDVSIENCGESAAETFTVTVKSGAPHEAVAHIEVDETSGGLPDVQVGTDNKGRPIFRTSNYSDEGEKFKITVDDDADNDGILDGSDNCKNVANTNQENVDGDAEGNACDSDDDNDGVLDASDNCPLDANADQLDWDDDGSGNACDSSPGEEPNQNTPPTVTISGVDPEIDPDGNVEGDAAGGATVEWTAGATDAEDTTDPAVSCEDAEGNEVSSGDLFALGGTHTVTCSATDTDGATGSDFITFTVVDTTDPEIAAHGNESATATSANGATVNYTTPTAEDIVDTDVSVACLPASGSVFGPGTTTVNCSATDDSGNTDTSSFTVSVTFDFRGFFQPIDGNIRNGMKSGSTAPMKFIVGDGTATGQITSTNIVQSSSGVRFTCSSGAAEDTLEEYATGGTSLRYDPTGKQFIYNWQSPKGKAGSCYRVTLVLTDNTEHYADFILK